MATEVSVLDLTPLGAAPATNDVIVMGDVSDPSQGAAGSVKIMTVANLFTAPTITGATVLAGGTVTASAPPLSITQTWNQGSTSFTAAKINVTDTTSLAASYLLDLQVAGVSKFNVAKSGAVTSVSTIQGTDVIATNDLIFSTNAKTLKGKTSGGATVSLLTLTNDTNNVTRFVAGVDLGGFQWSNQAQNVSWMTLIGGVLTVSSGVTITAGGLTVTAGGINGQTIGSASAFTGTVSAASGFTTGAAGFVMASSVNWTGAGTSAVPTLTTGPVNGEPSKWLLFNDNGTTRRVPSW